MVYCIRTVSVEAWTPVRIQYTMGVQFVSDSLKAVLGLQVVPSIGIVRFMYVSLPTHTVPCVVFAGLCTRVHIGSDCIMI